MLNIQRRSVTCLGAAVLIWGACCQGATGHAQVRRSSRTDSRGKQQVGPPGVLDPVSNKTEIYRADADARVEINGALARAVSEKKRLILVFGGNWCYDCHVLDRALHEGAAGKVVTESFLLLHVDIGEGDKNLDLVKKYKVPLEKGVPALVILNSAGAVLFNSSSGEFESARTMMKRDLLAFLNHWKGRANIRSS